MMHNKRKKRKPSKPGDRFGRNSELEHLYHSRRWRILRDQIMARDNYLCQMCQQPIIPRDPALGAHIDHRKPHNGDIELFWDVDNLQTLHQQCHTYKTRADYRGRIGPDGYYIRDEEGNVA